MPKKFSYDEKQKQSAFKPGELVWLGGTSDGEPARVLEHEGNGVYACRAVKYGGPDDPDGLREVDVSDMHRLQPLVQLAKKFLRYSFGDIKQQYSGLTKQEKELCNERDFKTLVMWLNDTKKES